jgi:hypothetical protein
MDAPPDSASQAATPGPAAASPPARRRIPVGWVVLVVVGAIVALMAIGPVVGGGFLLWAHATQRDDEGFYTTPFERFETTSYAITSDEIDLGAEPTDRNTAVDLGDIATVRIDTEGRGEQATFVGIGPKDQVDRYLDGVARAEVEDLSFDPFRVDYRHTDGDAPSALPGEQGFWVASSEGSGDQRVDWEPESGQWAVVIMNADATAGVSVDAALAAQSPWVFRIGVVLVAMGAFGLLLGAVMLVVGVVGLARGTHIDLTGPEAHPSQPVRLEARLDEPLSRWLWLVKWFLLIPHLIVLTVLWIAFSVVTFVAFFAILTTGRYPRALFEFNLGVLRWTWRVGYYSYSALGTDRYPPFSLGAEPDYPATFDVEYPQQLSRGLVLVKWWLLAIPQYLVLAVLGGGLTIGFVGNWGWMAGSPFGGLLGLLVLFAGVALLFAGQYPRGMFDLIMGANRWVYRVLTYVALMRDEYPPFRLDQGGSEPAPEPEPSPSTEPGAARAESPEDEVLV